MFFQGRGELGPEFIEEGDGSPVAALDHVFGSLHPLGRVFHLWRRGTWRAIEP